MVLQVWLVLRKHLKVVRADSVNLAERVRRQVLLVLLVRLRELRDSQLLLIACRFNVSPVVGQVLHVRLLLLLADRLNLVAEVRQVLLLLLLLMAVLVIVRMVMMIISN